LEKPGVGASFFKPFNSPSFAVKNFYPPLLPGVYYHIFNRGNNRETLFYTDENYRYFLGKYIKYLTPVLDTFAYCLLPNHFHLVVRVKSLAEINVSVRGTDFPGFKNLESLGLANRDEDEQVSWLVSHQFRLCFMSYAKALNKQRDRTGSLFEKNFKRLAVESAPYFARLILYVHANPQLHGIWDDYRKWPHSSYLSILSNGATRLCRETVIEWFGGEDAVIAAHQHYLELKGLDDLTIED